MNSIQLLVDSCLDEWLKKIYLVNLNVRIIDKKTQIISKDKIPKMYTKIYEPILLNTKS